MEIHEMHENVHLKLFLQVLLSAHTVVEFKKGLYQEVDSLSVLCSIK